MIHNENSRVKIPALVHLTRLGYQYISLKQQKSFENNTNINREIFLNSFRKLNGEDAFVDCEKELQNIIVELGQDDLGRSFYNRLLGNGNSPYKLIDWENFKNNSFHICTELPYKNGEDVFRPDITIFINGLPLAFIEVKKPNNPEGIKAERDRIHTRFQNEKFRKFINITQLLVFSNNMEYDDTGVDQLQGAFYATTAKNSTVKFNNFREERKNELPELAEINSDIEDFILKDNNLITLKHAAEFLTNKDERTPTNRILTSLFTKERLKMLLQYGIAYVEETSKTGEMILQKHIMRYPQFFAAKAIRENLEKGVKKGVVWHTQGSGKTALAFYCVRYLTDYFKAKSIVPRFYFIVDRLDLLTQATKEFRKRGLPFTTVNSKAELVQDFQKNTTQEGITVINIQKFNEDTTVFDDSGYDINVQRVYFIDEAHRSYDPKGSSLANLYNSDKKSIKIALTGTPLIYYKKHTKKGDETEFDDKADRKTTRDIFGDYIHKYYYNNSIKDGYTLKLLREEIETTYKDKLKQIQKDIEVISKSLKKEDLYAHKKFVTPLLDYILHDFCNSRTRFGDETIGAMVVCDSSEQARMMHAIFETGVISALPKNQPWLWQNVEKAVEFANADDQEDISESKIKHGLTSALILHDENDTDVRKQQVQDFKDGKIDVLFVYAMLLTGFDAPRLKKLYLGRKIKAHNLLQTLTRVNRPYRDFRMGYVVDFADISKEFDITNRAYFEELNREYDTATTGEDQNRVFGSLFMNKEEIDAEVENLITVLSDYSTDNQELFSQQIIAITDKDKILALKKSLESVRDVYNIARLQGYVDVLEKIDIRFISQLLTEVNNRLHLLNLQNSMADINSRELLNVAIESVVFDFTKIGEEELRMLANDLQENARKTREELNNNWNQKDPEWISLFDDLKNLLSKHKIESSNFTNETAKFISREILTIYDKIKELNRKNSDLATKFDGDRKYARIFKSQEKSGTISKRLWLYNILKSAKSEIDDLVSKNKPVLEHRTYFEQDVAPILIRNFELTNQKIDAVIVKNLTEITATEYLAEYVGNV